MPEKKLVLQNCEIIDPRDINTYLIMLMKYGLYSAIVDVFDTELVK